VDELKCYFRIALSESESIKVLSTGSPPASGVSKMIQKNQSFKELLSQQPVQKGRAKAIQPRIKEPKTRALLSLIVCKNVVANDTQRHKDKPILSQEKACVIKKQPRSCKI
jgi:hypothetical protein